MASIHKEIVVNSSPEQVWDAMRDVGALHTRLVPGFVVDCRVENGTRFVTFANGMEPMSLTIRFGASLLANSSPCMYIFFPASLCTSAMMSSVAA